MCHTCAHFKKKNEVLKNTNKSFLKANSLSECSVRYSVTATIAMLSAVHLAELLKFYLFCSPSFFPFIFKKTKLNQNTAEAPSHGQKRPFPQLWCRERRAV